MILDCEKKIVNKIYKNKIDIVSIIVLAVFVIIIFSPIINQLYGRTDYALHISVANKMMERQQILIPHFLYELSIIILNIFICNMGFNLAGYISVILFFLFLSVIIYFQIRQILIKIWPQKYAILTICLTISLLLVGPINILAYFDRHYYYGYIGINVFHNPTSIILKPLALLLFLCSVKIYDKNHNPTHVILSAVILSVMAIIAKPSFTICLLPALVIFSIIKYYKNESIDWKLLIFGILMPSILLLGIQYYFTFSAHQLYKIKSGIAILPFEVMRYHSKWLLTKYILSITFPISIISLYYKKAIKSNAMILSWIIFIFGTFYAYLMAETGPRINHMNFAWSGQISLFILFYVSTVFVLKQINCRNRSFVEYMKNNKQLYLLTFVYIMHFICGALFYLYEMKCPDGNLW